MALWFIIQFQAVSVIMSYPVRHPNTSLRKHVDRQKIYSKHPKAAFQVQPSHSPTKTRDFFPSTPCRQWFWETRRSHTSHRMTRCLPPVSLLCTLQEPSQHCSFNFQPTTSTCNKSNNKTNFWMPIFKKKCQHATTFQNVSCMCFCLCFHLPHTFFAG